MLLKMDNLESQVNNSGANAISCKIYSLKLTGNNWGFALITLILTTDGSTCKIMAGPLCCVPGQDTLPQGASLHPGILQLVNFQGHLLRCRG